MWLRKEVKGTVEGKMGVLYLTEGSRSLLSVFTEL